MSNNWKKFRDRNFLWLADTLSAENNPKFPEALKGLDKLDANEKNYLFSKMLIMLVSNEVN